MKIIILKPNGVGRYDDVSPFIVTDNKLELKVALPNFYGEFYLVTELGGRTEKRLLPGDGVITLENLAAGELNAAVKHYLKGAFIKEYKVEPLVLIEADGSITAEPEIAALTQRLATLETSFADYVKAAAEHIELQDKIIKSLLRFAAADYKSNVYLGCGSAEKFIEEYGFKLSEENIELIKKIIKGERRDVEN